MKMKAVLGLVVALVALAALAASTEADVVVLTDADFAEKTKTGTWLVEFYAPWCGHCKRLAPVWEELATSAKGKFNVAKVDCTAEQNTGKSQGIRGYPTIKLFHNGREFPYQGQRTVDAFTRFVEDSTGTAAASQSASANKQEATPAAAAAAAAAKEGEVVILDADTFDAKTKEGNWLIKFYAPWCGHCKRLAPTWDELAGKTEGKFKVAKVDCTQHQALCQKFSIRGYPTIKFVSGAKSVDYNGPRTIESFVAFANQQ